MAAGTEKKMSKTSFLTEFLGKNPRATTTAVNKAWAEAGHPGQVSPTLVSKLRSELGLAGNIRAGGGATSSNGLSTAAQVKTKPTSKAATTPEAAPRRSGEAPAMSSGTRGKGKSLFIKEHLFDHEHANATAVNAAWKAAGMKGTISDSLVSKMRSELGLAGNLRSKPSTTGGATAAKTPAKSKSGSTKSSASTPAAKPGRVSSRDRVLADVEGEIDRLIFKLLAVEGMEKAEDALRAARRIIVRSHKG